MARVGVDSNRDLVQGYHSRYSVYSLHGPFLFVGALVLSGLIGLALTKPVAAETTPSDVFAEAVRIEKEVELIREHLGITAVKPVTQTRTKFLPRHSWQIGYLILVKVNIFRRQMGLPFLTPNNLNPVLELEPSAVYEQTQRILTELRLVKRRLKITREIPPQEVEADKKPADVVNKLLFVSAQMDMLNQDKFTANDAFTEVKRLNEDVGLLLDHLKIQDVAFPPAPKPDATPSDSLISAFALLAEVQRLQQLASIARVDFGPFRKTTAVEPEDVFNVVILILAELQTVKAFLGLEDELTPPSRNNRDKSPSDVNQLLGYATNRLRLIQSLQRGAQL
ncbi:MAG: hypothetical protein HQL73_07920 [Magnetococcales bacterium]|nr:hypothetical protein [Magnetococcales bacterium]